MQKEMEREIGKRFRKLKKKKIENITNQSGYGRERKEKKEKKFWGVIPKGWGIGMLT